MEQLEKKHRLSLKSLISGPVRHKEICFQGKEEFISPENLLPRSESLKKKKTNGKTNLGGPGQEVTDYLGGGTHWKRL